MKKSKGINFKKYQFYFLGLIVLLMIMMSYYILKPFLITIVTSLILAYVFYPVYKKIKKFLKNKNIAALAVTLLIIIILVLPFLFMINTVSKEAYTSYIVLKQKLFTGKLFGIDCPDKTTTICKLSNFITNIVSEPQLRFYLDSAGQKTTSFVLESISAFLFSLPVKIINFFIMIFTLFYFLRDGDLFTRWIKKLLPLDKLHQKDIFEKFNEVTYGVIYGQIMIALVQGILGGIGFWIFGISSPIFWGTMMAFLSLIPYLDFFWSLIFLFY